MKNRNIPDVYGKYIGRLKFYPRLVPGPLWGLSFANISKLAPEIGLIISNDGNNIINETYTYWSNLNRYGTCNICGYEKVDDIDEDWRYYVQNNINILELDKNQLSKIKGEAHLIDIKPICKKCHLAKHIGYAQEHGKYKEAINQLALLNDISEDEAKLYGELVFKLWEKLSCIKNWTIRIGKLKNLNENLRSRIESFLNIMYKKGLFVQGIWLKYLNPNHKILIEKCEEEIDEIRGKTLDEIIKILEDNIKEAMFSSIIDSIRRQAYKTKYF